jgi:hypothetical protein
LADISTLVADIRGLLDNGHLAAREAPEIGSVIIDRLKEHLQPRSEKTLRMSNIGKPDRQLWYLLNYKGQVEQPDADAKLKWLFGDILESMLMWLAEEAGHIVTDVQKEIFVNDIKGHIDGKIDGVLVDAKSASSASYKRFTKEGMVTDPFLSTYLFQLAGYCEAEDCDGAFLVIDKQNGHLKLVPWCKEELAQVRIKQAIDRKKKLVKQKEIPDRCYKPIPDGKSGNLMLSIGCSYCDFKHECWKDANNGEGLKTYAYAAKYKLFTHIEKEPRVPQVDD